LARFVAHPYATNEVTALTGIRTEFPIRTAPAILPDVTKL
jgi:hypothetical protein